MAKPKPIQITIPKPCSENWDEMTPSGQGRFCDHCQKTVTDFTGWSDAALYEFFTKNKDANICGRMYKSQIQYPLIAIKPSTNNNLYKWFAGLGLTIVMTGAVDFNLYAKPPYAHTVPINTIDNSDAINDNFETTSDDTLIIRGTVANMVKQPISAAEVYITDKGGKALYGTTTNINGEFIIKMGKPEMVDSLSLYVTGLDYIAITIPLTSKKVRKPIQVNLKYEDMMIMGMIGGGYYDVPMQPAPEIKNKK